MSAIKKATYAAMKRELENLLNDLAILAGDKPTPAGVTWHDVAGTAALSANGLAASLYAAARGSHEAGIVFPSPSEALKAEGE
jgi:hypothetical protein